MTEETRIHDDPEALAQAVAEELIARLVAVQASGRDPVIGLTGGTVAAAVHRAVAASVHGLDVDWDRVDFWWGDERYVDASHEDRNAGQARRDLLDPVEADPDRIHEMPAADSGLDLNEAAASYADQLRAQGRGSFDVLFLGIGPDGHIASLFPDSVGVRATDAITVAVADSPKPPPERISLTLEALQHAESVWFIAAGRAKAPAVAAARQPGPVTELPARGVRGRAETIWWLDREAANDLD